MSTAQNLQTTTVTLSPNDIQADKQDLVLQFLGKIRKELNTNLIIEFGSKSSLMEDKWELLKSIMDMTDYRTEEEVQEILIETGVISKPYI